MADAYKILAATTVPELTPGTLDSTDVQQVSVQSSPSGVTFTVKLPSGEGFTPDAVHAAAEPIAEAFNELATHKRVSRIQVTQEPNAGGSYEDTVVVTVTSGSGKLSDTVRIPLASLSTEQADEAVDAAAAKLDAIEAL